MRIGFIGLGNMGRGMASRLAGVGHDLIVFDIVPTRVAELTGVGVKAAQSAFDVGKTADIVFGCLPSCESAFAVAAETIKGGHAKTYIETATVGPSVVAEIVKVANEANCVIVDAPISGGAQGAREGTLAVMAGCSVAAFGQVEPLFKAIATRIFHVGKNPGMGQICKLANNAISFAALIATCEAVAMGVKAGVNPTTLIDVINAGTGRNAATIDRFPNAVLPGTFNGGAPLGGALKDLNLYLNEADRVGVASEMMRGVAQTWAESLKEFDSEADFTNIVRYFERRAGVEIRAIASPPNL